MPLSEANTILEQALALASTDPRVAVTMLAQGMDSARARGDTAGIVKLAMHAGLVSGELGEPREAIGYYEIALSHAPGRADLHFLIGDIHRRLGQVAEARAAFVHSLELATEQQDATVAELAAKGRDELDRGTT